MLKIETLTIFAYKLFRTNRIKSILIYPFYLKVQIVLYSQSRLKLWL